MPDTHDLRSGFLLASLQDIQTIIRALDAKLGILLTFLILPVTALDRIVVVGRNLATAVDVGPFAIILGLAAIAFVIAWAAALVAAFRGLRGTQNPDSRISGAPGLGTFYGPGMYDLHWYDAFRNRPCMSMATVQEWSALLPQSRDALVGELAFEQMKLMYIRDIKLLRQSIAFSLTMAWLGVGTCLWIAELVVAGTTV